MKTWVRWVLRVNAVLWLLVLAAILAACGGGGGGEDEPGFVGPPQQTIEPVKGRSTSV